MNDGKVLFAHKNNICFIKMIGSIKCTTVSEFDAFVIKLVKDQSLEDVFIDLCNTTYIDSTNFGLLAEISRVLMKRFNKKPTILSTNPKVNILIEGLGFDKVFNVIRTVSPTTDTLEEIPGVVQSQQEKAKMILKAHRNIIAMSEKNEILFRDVVKILEDQIDEDPLRDKNSE